MHSSWGRGCLVSVCLGFELKVAWSGRLKWEGAIAIAEDVRDLCWSAVYYYYYYYYYYYDSYYYYYYYYYEGVLISPYPDLLPDVVGRNR